MVKREGVEEGREVCRWLFLQSDEDWRMKMAAYQNDILSFLHSGLFPWIWLDIKGRVVDMRREGKQRRIRHSFALFSYSSLLRSATDNHPLVLIPPPPFTPQRVWTRIHRCGPCRSICLLLDPSPCLDLFFFSFDFLRHAGGNKGGVEKKNKWVGVMNSFSLFFFSFRPSLFSLRSSVIALAAFLICLRPFVSFVCCAAK